nr:hypothetical protein [Tanacetum cinerariifolium]
MNSNKDELVLTPHKNWYKACRLEIEAPWCLFVVGLSGEGSGIGVRVEEWQENGEKWGRNGWREK